MSLSLGFLSANLEKQTMMVKGDNTDEFLLWNETTDQAGGMAQ